MMIFLYILIALVLVILITGLFISKDANYEKSVSIPASPEKIWPHVSKLAAMDQWSPWSSRDPNMKTTLTGTDGTVGARQAWESKVKNVGEGSQTITRIEAPSLIETRLEFIKPFKSIATAYISLIVEGSGTRVTWGFRSKMPYPMNLMKLFMNFEKAMDKDFSEGLGKLKMLCEA